MNSCRFCGCTDHAGCWDDTLDAPCFWVESDLCSVCAREIYESDSSEDEIPTQLQWNAEVERILDLDHEGDQPRILGPDGRPFTWE